jgi:membrane protease YdiL (CAAX protease family)
MNERPPIIPGAMLELTPESVEKPIWGPWSTLGLGAVIFFVLIVVAAVVLLIMIVALSLPALGTASSLDDLTTIMMNTVRAKLGLVFSVATIVSYAMGTLLIIAFIKVRKGKSIGEYLGLKRVGWRTVLLLVLLTLFFQVIVVFLGYVTKIDSDETGMLANLYDTSVWPALLWIAVVVMAPVFEEPLARGFLFEGFRHSRLGLVGAILLTSLIWTALHVGYVPLALGEIFVLGLVLGYVRYRTGSLWSTILMHACFNAVSTVALALSRG